MDKILPRHDFKAGLGFRLTRASTILQSAVETALEPLGLNRMSWIVLSAIRFDDNFSVTEVSKYIGMERTAVSRTVSRLEQDGFLKREKSRTDGRASRLEVTQKGEEICQRVPDIIQAATAPHLMDLSPNQIRQLGELLDLVQSEETLIWPGKPDQA